MPTTQFNASRRATRLAALTATGLAVLTAAPAAIAGPAGNRVSVRIEGPRRTLLATKTVNTHAGSVTKGGTPRGACPSNSAAGALTAATRGHWKGKYYASVPGIFITSIFSTKPSGHEYWTVFVNNRSSSVGICQVKLRRGERLLFAVTDGTQVPLVLRAPHKAAVNHPLTVTAGYFGKRGFRRAAGVTVTGAGAPVKTDKHGHVTVLPTQTGTLVLHASGRGYVRAAPLRVKITQ